MRGSPLLRALLAFIFIAMAGVPLWRLTHAGDRATIAPRPAATASEIAMKLTFSTAPQRFSIVHLGGEVWTQEAPGGEVAKVVRLAYPAEGIDLQVKVSWSADARESALRIAQPWEKLK